MKYDRQISILVPYRSRNGVLEIFLQKRSLAAKRNPGKFGFFGGHLEDNETPEQGLIREIQEELTIAIDHYDFLGEFPLERDGEHIMKYAYPTKVQDNFEESIHIKEGDYGQWFTEEKLRQESNVIPHDRE